MTIGERIRKERNKHGLTQTQLSELIGKVKKTVIDYEKGNTSPDADILAIMAKRGFDVIYIITGIYNQHSQSQRLNSDDAELLDHLDMCSKEDSQAIKRLAKFAAIGAKKNADHGYQTANSEQRTANSEQRTANSEQRTANSEQFNQPE